MCNLKKIKSKLHLCNETVTRFTFGWLSFRLGIFDEANQSIGSGVQGQILPPSLTFNAEFIHYYPKMRKMKFDITRKQVICIFQSFL